MVYSAEIYPGITVENVKTTWNGHDYLNYSNSAIAVKYGLK